MKFQNFNRVNLDSLRKDLNKVLSDYGVDNNITFDLGNFRFNESEVKMQLRAVVSNGKNNEDLQEVDFNKYAGVWGVQAKFGEVLRDGSKVIGFKPSRRKYPVLLEKRGGKKVLSTVESVNLMRNA